MGHRFESCRACSILPLFHIDYEHECLSCQRTRIYVRLRQRIQNGSDSGCVGPAPELTAKGSVRFVRGTDQRHGVHGSSQHEQALVDALTQNTIAGAGLDVYTQEPQVPEPLKALNNVVLAPHIGSGTHETRTAMEALVLENLQSFFSTGRLLTPVI